MITAIDRGEGELRPGPARRDLVSRPGRDPASTGEEGKRLPGQARHPAAAAAGPEVRLPDSRPVDEAQAARAPGARAGRARPRRARPPTDRRPRPGGTRPARATSPIAEPSASHGHEPVRGGRRRCLATTSRTSPRSSGRIVHRRRARPRPRLAGVDDGRPGSAGRRVDDAARQAPGAGRWPAEDAHWDRPHGALRWWERVQARIHDLGGHDPDATGVAPFDISGSSVASWMSDGDQQTTSAQTSSTRPPVADAFDEETRHARVET